MDIICLFIVIVVLKAVFFFSRDTFRFAREIVWKSAREIWKSARDKKPQIVPVKMDELTVTKQLTTCPWKMKSGRDNF